VDTEGTIRRRVAQRRGSAARPGSAGRRRRIAHLGVLSSSRPLW